MNVKRACISRADLLWCLHHRGEEGLSVMARYAGYYFQEKPKEPKKLMSLPQNLPAAPSEEQGIEHRFASSRPMIPFWRIIEHRARKADDVSVHEPAWLKEGDTLTGDEHIGADRAKTPPPAPPLVPWSVLWPFLRSALGIRHDSRRIDLQKVIASVARGEPIRNIPRRKRRGWAFHCQVILNFDERLLPFWQDIMEFLHGIVRLRGWSGLEVLAFEEGSGGPCRPWGTWEKQSYRLPEPGTPILVVSDLGCLDPEKVVRSGWVRFGRRLKRAGFFPVALTPCPPRLWDEELGQYWRLACWDRGERFPRFDRHDSPGSSIRRRLSEPGALGAERLLALLSSAIRVEPALLRAVRLLLPRQEADVGTEAEVWLHHDLRVCPLGFSFDKASISGYRDLFAKEPKPLQKLVTELIKKYHAHLSPAVRYEEALLCSTLSGEDMEAKQAGDYLRCAVRTLDLDQQSFSYQAELRTWLSRLSDRQHRQMWEQHEVLAVAWAIINRDEWKEGRLDLPPGLDINQVVWVLSREEALCHWVLLRKADTFILLSDAAISEQAAQDWSDLGSPVGKLTTAHPLLQVMEVTDNKINCNYTIDLKGKKAVEIMVSACDRLVLKTDHEEAVLTSDIKPPWASAIGCDIHGLFVTFPDGNPDGNDERRVYWFNPGIYEVTAGPGIKYLSVTHGFWWDEQEFLEVRHHGFQKPAWAETIGIDEYGLYADFSLKGVSLKGVVQRMRWIPPGIFMMGSPEEEPERGSNERLHEVVITRGYWLADTVCTQDLWEAVMGKSNNPSRFNGAQRPVEQVSWNEVIKFIGRINKMKDGLDLRLPTEAEWEYACRAGTKTPFWFGENITPDQVNYDGNNPYAGGEKGIYRKETVAVKSLPINGWGVYEMHGNVWEWCADRYGEYPSGPVVDPVGPDQGGYRVLRGGSWGSDGRVARSANRNRSDPADRGFNDGFRLARGQKQ